MSPFQKRTIELEDRIRVIVFSPIEPTVERITGEDVEVSINGELTLSHEFRDDDELKYHALEVTIQRVTDPTGSIHVNVGNNTGSIVCVSAKGDVNLSEAESVVVRLPEAVLYRHMKT